MKQLSCNKDHQSQFNADTCLTETKGWLVPCSNIRWLTAVYHSSSRGIWYALLNSVGTSARMCAHTLLKIKSLIRTSFFKKKVRKVHQCKSSSQNFLVHGSTIPSGIWQNCPTIHIQLFRTCQVLEVLEKWKHTAWKENCIFSNLYVLAENLEDFKNSISSKWVYWDCDIKC